MEDERLQRLQKLAVEGDVDALFSELAEDPYVLERIDQIPFVTTPLHAAASKGKTHFAKEILNLKPSFAWKRDHLGRGPLHLALEGKHLQKGLRPRDSDLEKKYQELVTWLIKHDSELVRVKARGMVTPLHYAAQLDDEFNLANFLYVCPSSIHDVTVKSETAVHVALKNGSFKAFKVLLGWLRHFNKEEILYWKDEEGNNALHTAVSENQPEAVKLLIGCMKVNIKNGKGLTALDIFYDRQGSLDAAVGDILPAAKAKTRSEHYCSQIRLPNKIIYFFGLQDSLVEYFSGGLSFSGRILKCLGLSYLSLKNIPHEVRNVLLVVAILIATATYQAVLSPPGGYWQDDGYLQPANNTGISNTTTIAIGNTTTNIFSRGPSKERAGHMIMGSAYLLLFLICNSSAFFASVFLILILATGLPFFIIITSTSLMVGSFSIAVLYISFYSKVTVVGILFCGFLVLSGAAAYYIPVLLKTKELELTLQGRHRNLRLGSFDNPKM